MRARAVVLFFILQQTILPENYQSFVRLFDCIQANFNVHTLDTLQIGHDVQWLLLEACQ